MGEATKIEWTDHTFNPWRGCSKVHTGCKNCYAETQSKRNHGVLGIWGEQGTRVVASESMWREPLKWNAVADAEGVRRRVFCASLADVFEDSSGQPRNSNGDALYVCQRCGKWCWQNDLSPHRCRDGGLTERVRHGTIDDVRRRLFRLIDATPHLDWLLLTKRPGNIQRMWSDCAVEGNRQPHSDGRNNVWIGTSISDQETADKAVPELLACRDLAPVLFLSAEPLVGPIDLEDALPSEDQVAIRRGHPCEFDWVIVGGESGAKARPCRPEWARSLVRQCQLFEVPVFVKQMGANVITRNDAIEDEFNNGVSGWPDPQVQHDIHGFREEFQGADCRIRLRDRKGGNPDEWPQDLRVRLFPEVRSE